MNGKDVVFTSEKKEEENDDFSEKQTKRSIVPEEADNEHV